jgi:hypothetical protein
MPAGCKKCDSGVIECGPDLGELCADSGGWTKAGALCLQFWVAKDKKGNCKIQVDVTPLFECGGDETGPESGSITVSKPKPKTKGKKR